MSETKTYPLSLARSYVRHWGLVEAIRELIQNAIDGDGDETPFEYAFEDHVLSITNRYASLSPSTLLLGSTSKADNPEKIGSFGEGYKLALLVLVREGYDVLIRNGALEWRPEFEHSADFGEEMLVIRETQADTDAQAVTFEIRGLTADDRGAVRDMCLRMQAPMYDVIGVEQGHILPSRAGKLYVGGLFVCNTDMHYGYDVKPSFLALERDRQTVDGFSLKLLTERMWLGTKDWARICDMLEAEALDVESMQYGAPPKELAEFAAFYFDQKNRGKLPVSSQADADKLRHTSSTVFVSRAYSNVVASAPAVSNRIRQELKVKSPKQALEAWLDSHKKYLRRLPKVSFKALVKDSEQWRGAQ